MQRARRIRGDEFDVDTLWTVGFRMTPTRVGRSHAGQLGPHQSIVETEVEEAGACHFD